MEKRPGLDNPQGSSVLSPEFLAGLIVGEGSYGINIARVKGPFPFELRPFFSLRMNDIDTFEAFCEAFTFYGLAHYRSPYRYKKCAQMFVSGFRRMDKHLDFFLPMLTGKKLQAAQIVDAFTKKRLYEKTVPAPYDSEDIESIEMLRSINGPCAGRLSLEPLRDYIAETNSKARVR
jgi:hypothetical protein